MVAMMSDDREIVEGSPATTFTQGPRAVDWSDDELALLERHYCLDGAARVSELTGRSTYSVRHKASRLDLDDDMKIYTPLADVAREAGVGRDAISSWLKSSGYRRFCRLWGGHELLLPLPVVRRYLELRPTAWRVARRPRGWWGVAKVADYLGVHVNTVYYHARKGALPCVMHGAVMFFDPHGVRDFHDARLRERA